MPQHEIMPELISHLAPGRSVGLVKTERNAKHFKSEPEGIIIRLVPVMSVDDIRSQKYRAKSELLNAALSFGNGIVNVKD